MSAFPGHLSFCIMAINRRLRRYRGCLSEGLDTYLVQQYTMFMISEHVKKVNKKIEDPLVQQGLETLTALLGIESSSLTVKSGTRREGTPDLLLTLSLSDQQLPVCAEIVRHLRPAHLPLLKHKFDHLTRTGSCKHVLVMTNYVSPSLACQLREVGIWFVDTVGNAYLEIPGELMVYAIGNRPAPSERLRGQHLSPAGAKILFLLLKYGPEISLTYRDMATALGVSLGRISQVMQELLQIGILIQQKKGRYRVVQPKRLLENWTRAYLTKLKPKLILGRYVWPYGRDFSRIITLAKDHAVARALGVGGEYAAEILTGHLRAGIMSLWITEEKLPQFRRSLKLLKSNEGLLEAVSLFSAEVLFEHEGFPLPLVHPVIVYADLLDTDDPRCGETALLLKEKYLSWIS